MSEYVKGVVLSEEHTLDVEELLVLVQKLKWDYIETYKVEPKYIKMPMWVFVLLRHYNRQLVGYDENKTPTYLGFKICETTSISSIYSIQLF